MNKAVPADTAKNTGTEILLSRASVFFGSTKLPLRGMGCFFGGE